MNPEDSPIPPTTTPYKTSASGVVRTVALVAIVALLALTFWRLNSPPAPDPRLIDVSVRSTVFALPTQTPRIVIATQVVEVTRIVEVTRAITPSVPEAGTPEASSLREVAPQALALRAADVAAIALADIPVAAESAAVEPARAPEPAPEPAPVQAPAPQAPAACPASSDRSYDAIPIASAPAEHPDSIHGDLNLFQRGWQPVDAALTLVDINGPTDDDPPQIAHLFGDGRLPAFTSAAQVYDWDWACAPHGCRSGLMTHREVMLLGMGTAPGEAISIPDRNAQIYGGGYKALVLYAEPNRITLGYTRDDSVAHGYAVHLEGLCVDPNLVNLYRSSNAQGRGSLPALRNEEILGTATGEIRIATRDRGVFFDPRSRKDWWRGF